MPKINSNRHNNIDAIHFGAHERLRMIWPKDEDKIEANKEKGITNITAQSGRRKKTKRETETLEMNKKRRRKNGHENIKAAPNESNARNTQKTYFCWLML